MSPRRETYSIGDGPCGLPFMKFTLTFDGKLPASANSSKLEYVWKIRKEFHPQLQELARENVALREALEHSKIPTVGKYVIMETHHSNPIVEGRIASSGPKSPLRDLYEPISIGGKRFQPIVRKSMGLACFLDIVFLRKEGALFMQDEGKHPQGGDLDGRIKTLFDALSAPASEQQIKGPESEKFDEPIFCVMEDDSLITGFNIRTGHLLTMPNADKSQVHLMVTIDVRVIAARGYNILFLGD